MHEVKVIKQETKYDLEKYLEDRSKRAEQREPRKPRGFAKRRDEKSEGEDAERDGTRG